MRNNRRKFNRHNNRNTDKNANSGQNNKNRNQNETIKFVSTNVSKKNDNKQPGNDKNRNDNKKALKLFNMPGKNENKNANQNKYFNRNSGNNKFNQQNKNLKQNNVPPKKRLLAYKVNTLEKEDCVLCNKKIIDMATSIKDEENNKFYHFDCILKEIENDKKNKNVLKSIQRVVYLGSGAFGIVEDYKENGKSKFKIIDKIDYFVKDVL